MPLHLQLSADVRHLRDDIEVAEELGVRYADHVGDRQPASIFGIQVRARMTSSAGLPRLRDECNAKLFAEIGKIHDVSSDDVATVRSTLSNKGADLPVNIPMAGAFLIAVLKIARWLRTRFGPDEKPARWTATLLGSLFVSVTGVLIGNLWGAVVEMVRLGNEHLSYRLPRLSWRQHFVEVLVIQIVAFWIVVAVDGWVNAARTASSGASATAIP